jgi:hypothetical protein
MVISIKGTVVQGLRAAKDTLKLQMPYFVKLFPEVKDCHLASINLELEHGLRVFNPDFTTPPIPWAGPPGERFSFLRIAFEGPIGSPHRPAWIYIPHGSPHYDNVFHAEVITNWMENIEYGVRCQVHISKPYREAVLIII